MRVQLHFPNLTGKQFGWLKVLKRLEHKKQNSQSILYLCGCWCGNYTEVEAAALRRGATKSCRYCNLNTKFKSEYISWCHMKSRCTNPKAEGYENYGGRGIIVCERWMKYFQHFIEDLGVKPASNYSLERKNVNGNYEPENCIWLPDSEQAKNTRRSYINRI